MGDREFPRGLELLDFLRVFSLKGIGEFGGHRVTGEAKQLSRLGRRRGEMNLTGGKPVARDDHENGQLHDDETGRDRLHFTASLNLLGIPTSLIALLSYHLGQFSGKLLTSRSLAASLTLSSQASQRDVPRDHRRVIDSRRSAMTFRDRPFRFGDRRVRRRPWAGDRRIASKAATTVPSTQRQDVCAVGDLIRTLHREERADAAGRVA